MTLTHALVAAVLLSTAAAAQVAPAAPQPPAGFTPVNTKLVVRAPETAKVRVQEGIVFKTVEGNNLAMDVYGPASGAPKPAVVLVSGGERVRDWGLYKDYGRLIAAADLVAVIPDKRYNGPQSMEQGSQDTLDLLAHVRQNAGKYGIDGDRICMWTFSAGGSLVQLGMSPDNKLACTVAYYGLGQAGPRIALQQHGTRMPPMLLVRAGRDNPGLNNAIDVFASLAFVTNAPVTLVNYPEGLHAFEVEDFRPDVRTPANVAETERIFRLTLDWIRARTGSPIRF